jgi:hypothetical protein
MVYGFPMMPSVEIRSAKRLEEPALLRQALIAVVTALSEMFPILVSSRNDHGGWFDGLVDECIRYEFNINPEPDYARRIHGSSRTRTRGLLAPICNKLGLSAFDSQVSLRIRPDGVKPA